VLVLEVVACFLGLHDTRFEPKITAKPPIDLLSSRNPTESASKKALTSVKDDWLILSHVSTLPLSYLSMFFTVVQCI